MKKQKTFNVGRDPETGILVSVEMAKKFPKKYIIENMPKTGYGDTN